MSTKTELLDILQAMPDKYVSGTEIAKKLNISRNAVWKAIKVLEKEGYIIDSVSHRGYRLSTVSDVIDAGRIEQAITSYKCNVLVFPELASTNLTAKGLAANGEPEGTVIIAEKQTNGKGRMGRRFFSPAKTGLYMSIILRPVIQPSQALLITTAAAAAVAEILFEYTQKNIWIKWVNDIFCENLKVSGILTEAVFNAETSGLEYAILGIGINMKTPNEEFPDEIRDIAGVVGLDNKTRNELAAAILNRFFTYYMKLPEKCFLDSYRGYMKLTGHEVFILPGPTTESARIGLSGDKRYSEYQRGIVTGVTDNFHLLVRLSDGKIQELSSGEIELI